MLGCFMRPHELTLKQSVDAIRERKLTAVELARGLVDRQRAVDGKIHALAHVDADRLLEEAERVDRRIAAVEPIGALAGVPIGVKDIYDCAGLPTGNGVHDAEPCIAETTAPSVERLTSAGALVFGKTVTTDRAFLDPGPTCNPWNVAHTPGGSSSGSAAGVAARIFPAALGTQTAGSVIRPAAFCGLIGMTVSRGRIPMDGILPLAPSYDTVGFFVRSVDDAELLLAAWCHGDGHGPRVDRLPLPPLQRPVFLGFARRGFLDRVEDATAHHALQVTKRLLQKGAIVHVLRMPERFDRFEEFHRPIMAYEAARVHRAEFEARPSSFGPKLSALIEQGLRIGDDEYRAFVGELDAFREEMLARIHEVDAIVLPSAAGGAPHGFESTGDPICNAPWTAIGFPAITVPSGFDEDGLPLGLQIVGKPMGERFLLRMARLCVEAIGHGCPVPEL